MLRQLRHHRFPNRLVWRALSTSTHSAPAERNGAGKRILCVDVPSKLAESSCIQELVQRGHHVDHVKSSTVDASSGLEIQTSLKSIIDQYDAMLVSPETIVPRALLQKGGNAKLKMIAVPADAIDSAHIDLMEATNQDIMLLQLDKKQVGDKFSVEAEMAISLLIQLARHVPASIAATKATSTTKYQREQFTGIELFQKNLGIIGLGQAGKCVAEMARAMGLNVYGYDPNLTHEAAECMGVKRLTLDQLYATCDFVTFHAPLTARTRKMFDNEALKKCKDGIKIISVAEYKGLNGVLDENTLLSGLESGRISGIGLDVLRDDEQGDLTTDMSTEWKQLLQHSSVITNVHVDMRVGGEVASARRYRTIAENMSDALAQRYYRGVANGVFMGLTLVPEMKPFLHLGEAMGRLLSQLQVNDTIAKVSIATSGGIQVDITTPQAKSAIQGAVMKGIMTATAPKQKISVLNSSMLAMTNGIDVRQGELSGDEAMHLNNSITIEVETKSKTKTVLMGSVFGEDPRIVRLNEYSDFPAFRPEGNLLIFNNQDKPGAIAGILKELATAQINIANFGLSRQTNVPLALGILSLDDTPSDATIANLKQLAAVQNLRFAQV